MIDDATTVMRRYMRLTEAHEPDPADSSTTGTSKEEIRAAAGDVMQRMGITPVVHWYDGGDDDYDKGMHIPGTGEMYLNSRALSSIADARGVTAHELMHHKFTKALHQYEAEKQAGTRGPAHAALWSFLEGPDRDKLRRAGGVSSYSQKAWRQAALRPDLLGAERAAHHETLAEIARLKEAPETVQGAMKVQPIWRRYFSAVNRLYQASVRQAKSLREGTGVSNFRGLLRQYAVAQFDRKFDKLYPQGKISFTIPNSSMRIIIQAGPGLPDRWIESPKLRGPYKIIINTDDRDRLAIRQVLVHEITHLSQTSNGFMAHADRLRRGFQRDQNIGSEWEGMMQFHRHNPIEQEARLAEVLDLMQQGAVERAAEELWWEAEYFQFSRRDWLRKAIAFGIDRATILATEQAYARVVAKQRGYLTTRPDIVDKVEGRLAKQAGAMAMLGINEARTVGAALPSFEEIVTPQMRAALNDEFDKSVHGIEGYMSADSVEQWIRDRMPEERQDDPDLLDDPQFHAAFETWLQARYQEVRRKLSRLAARPTIKAWRVLRVPHNWLQHPRGDLGVYWTYNLRQWNAEIGAYPIWADEAADTIDILITAEVPSATVDWVRTMRAHMDYYSGDREFELRLKPGSPVAVQKVQDLGTRRPLRVTGSFTA